MRRLADGLAGLRRRLARRGGGSRRAVAAAAAGRQVRYCRPAAAATFVREFYTTNWIIDSYEIMVLVLQHHVLGVRECVRAASLACMCLEVRVRV